MQDARPRTPIFGVAVFTAAYMLASLVATLLLRNREFLFYIVTMAGLLAAVAAVHRRVNLSRGALWCLSLWGLVHMAGGLVPLPADWPVQPPNHVLYSLWLIPDHLKYDQVVHAYGFGVTTWVCWQGLQAIHPAPRATFGRLVLSGSAALGFGALNEVIEFAATRILPHTNVGGYENTGWDLVSNLVGVLVAILILARAHRGAPARAADA